MFLSLRELRRAPARFLLLAGAVALLTFLILFQQAIQNALLRELVGGVRNQNAPVLVFNTDGRRLPQSSLVPNERAAQVADLPEVGDTASIWQNTFPVTAEAEEGAVTGAAAVYAMDDPNLGGPGTLAEGRLPERVGEVLASTGDEDAGYRLGATVTAVPGVPLTIVGTATEAGITGLPTLYTSPETYLQLLRTRNPAAAIPPANVLAVRPADGVSASTVTAAINNLGDDLDALTRADAADLNPAVQSITSSFRTILFLFGIVVPLVTGLFFLILTTQKAGSLTLLRAMGAPAGRLVASLLTQVALVLVLGLGLATALYYGVANGKLGDLTLQAEPAPLIFWLVALTVLGFSSALASIRRVLAIDPIEATTGAGVGR